MTDRKGFVETICPAPHAKEGLSHDEGEDQRLPLRLKNKGEERGRVGKLDHHYPFSSPFRWDHLLVMFLWMREEWKEEAGGTVLTH